MFLAADNFHACVEQILLSVFYNGASGENAEIVIVLIRSHGCGQILPMEKIAALRMTPVHAVPPGFVGVILEKKMMLSFIIGKTVGIVHPAHGIRKMNRRPGNAALLCFLQGTFFLLSRLL